MMNRHDDFQAVAPNVEGLDEYTHVPSDLKVILKVQTSC